MGRHRAVVQPVSGNNGAQFWFVRIARNYKPGFGPAFIAIGPPPFSGVLLAVSLAVTGLIKLVDGETSLLPSVSFKPQHNADSKGTLARRLKPKVTAKT